MHVVLVAHRFPPQTGGGVFRPLKFAKFLSRLGHRITVLTAPPAPRDPGDPELLRELPAEVQIITVRERSALPAARRRLPAGAPLGSRLLQRARVATRWFVFQCMVPDECAGFITPAARLASHPAVRGCDVVVATGGPWAGFLAGERLARRLQRPLVLDYRDPWTTMVGGTGRSYGWLARRVNRRVERAVVARADAIVSVWPDLPRMLEEHLRLSGVVSRSHWIPNGFDPEDFAGEVPPASEFTITFAGALYGTRTLRPFLRVLEDLVRAEKIPLDRLRVRVIGPSWEQIRSDLAGSALERRVDAPGQLSHAETLRHMRATTLNLLVDIIYQGPNIHVPGKLYEYLKAGRPVLALSVPGQTESLIREAEAGWVVPPGDEAALRAVLVSAFEDWQAGRALPRPRQEVAQRYDRARQAGRLVEVLQECIERFRKGKGSA